MHITLIRNATLRVQTPEVTVLVDPWLEPKGASGTFGLGSGLGPGPSPLVDLPMPIGEVLQGVDAVLLTHLHPDHFCRVARETIARNMPILCPPEHSSAVREMGFSDVRAVEGTARVGDINLISTPAEHGPPEMLARMGPVSGYLLQGLGSRSVHLAGDTILSDAVRGSLALHRPDAVILNAGGALSKGMFGPIIMTAPEVVETLRLTPQAEVVAIHLDTTDHATVTRQSLKLYVDTFAPELAPRLAVPFDGETLSFAR